MAHPRNGHGSLLVTARRCEDLLERLKQHADHSKRRHLTTATLSLLDEVAGHVTGNCNALKAWSAAVRQGRQTTDLNIIKTVDEYFLQLESRIAHAENALRHRLGLRMLLHK